MKSSGPKIVYNEECVDLRECVRSNMNTSHFQEKRNYPPFWSNDVQKGTTTNDKNQTVNTALKKLAKTYNSNSNDFRQKPRSRDNSFEECRKKFSGAQNTSFNKSKSDMSSCNLLKVNNIRKGIYPSSPTIPSICQSSNSKHQLFKNKFTMTKLKDGKNVAIDKSLEKLIGPVTNRPSSIDNNSWKNTLWKDYRLVEKYSLLKVPWKRSYTLPVITSRPSVFATGEAYKKSKKYSDKRTYYYDDGSEIDSLIYKQHSYKGPPFFRNTLQFQVFTLLNISAYVCAILILALIVWFVSGSKIFYDLLIPKPPENPVKKYAKFIGGGVIYTLSSIIRFIGRIFSMPTQELYRPAPEYWPPMT